MSNSKPLQVILPQSSPGSTAAELLQLVTQRQSMVGHTGKRFDSLGAQSTLNNLVTLQSLMETCRPMRTLETGLAFGASASVIAACHREHGQAGCGQHVAIDPFQRTVWDDTARITLEKTGLDGYATVLNDFSDAALPRLLADGWQCDLAYIDGSHLFEDAFVDFYLVNLLLRRDGIILFDDSTNPHVRKVLRFIQRNHCDSYTKLHLLAYRPAAARTLTYQIARQIGQLQLTAFRKIGESRRPWNSRFSAF